MIASGLIAASWSRNSALFLMVSGCTTAIPKRIAASFTGETAPSIPSEARNLHFAAECRFLASLGMTIHEEGSLPLSRLHHFLDLALDQVALQCADVRSEEHTSELQSLRHLVCRL